MKSTTKLEDQSREELLNTVRHVLVEAEALSSRIVAVNEIGIAINRTFDIEEILNVVATQAKWLLDFQHCSVVMRDANANWSVKTVFGNPLNFADVPALMSSALGKVILRGQSRLINDDTESGFFPDLPSKILIPLNHDKEVIGTINFASNHRYSHEDLRIGYLLALQLASAIRNAEQVKALERAQLILEDYAKELELQNQELDAYSHTIAHDLKSPLSVIMMKTGLVKRYLPDAPPKVLRNLDEIINRTEHMADMIDQLLLLSKLRDMNQTFVRVNTNHVIQRSLTRFIEIETGKVKVDIQPNLPRVIGHAQWLEEVFANLISNAIKYRGDENLNPRIRITTKRDQQLVRFEVTDNGIGIRKEDQAHLFKMFTRLHHVKAEGLGLGLSIVHRIVTRLGGELGVESEWGKGTTFWFTMASFENFETDLQDEEQATSV